MLPEGGGSFEVVGDDGSAAAFRLCGRVLGLEQRHPQHAPGRAHARSARWRWHSVGMGKVVRDRLLLRPHPDAAGRFLAPASLLLRTSRKGTREAVPSEFDRGTHAVDWAFASLLQLPARKPAEEPTGDDW